MIFDLILKLYYRWTSELHYRWRPEFPRHLALADFLDKKQYFEE
jgi:hypothetical protein